MCLAVVWKPLHRLLLIEFYIQSRLRNQFVYFDDKNKSDYSLSRLTAKLECAQVCTISRRRYIEVLLYFDHASLYQYLFFIVRKYKKYLNLILNHYIISSINIHNTK